VEVGSTQLFPRGRDLEVSDGRWKILDELGRQLARLSWQSVVCIEVVDE
jgi:hypothetical protein